MRSWSVAIIQSAGASACDVIIRRCLAGDRCVATLCDDDAGALCLLALLPD